MHYQDLFNLNTNPFRIIPAKGGNEIFWAGFPDIKEAFEKRIKRSMQISASSLVLNWGEYGSGKTHAARYFGKSTVLAELAQQVNSKIPYFIYLSLPKGKAPIEDMYTSIIDKIDIQGLRVSFEGMTEQLNAHIDATEDNFHIKAVLKAVFNPEVDVNVLKRYLYKNTTATEIKDLNQYNILRALSIDTDFPKIIAGLFTCITYQKEHYSCIILWIDEFEDIAVMTKVNGDKTNSFLRDVLDNTPNNFLVFLNLTQSALFNIEDLGEYISEAIKSRIKQRIIFELPNENNLLLYVKELLSFYRTDPAAVGKIDYYPFNDELLKRIFIDLKNGSLRKANEALGLLLEIAEAEGVTPLNREYYDTNKDDVIGDWKD
jgi:hypothetical protein